MTAGWRDVSTWERLVSSPEAVAEAALVTVEDAASIARLRRRFDSDLVAAALELARARRKAARKFAPARGLPGGSARELWCDVQGVEQASGALVAEWKARRMREVLGEGGAVLDICAGIGGDSMAMAAAGLRVTAVELDPRRAWMCARNAGCEVRCVDAESVELADAALHVDPARRDEDAGARSWRMEDHRPGPEWIARAIRESRAAAVKFSPGVERASPVFAGIPIEWEWIAEGAQLVQAVAWTGAFAHDAGESRATILGRGADGSVSAHTLCGTPDDPAGTRRADRTDCAGGPASVAHEPPSIEGRFLSEPHPAVERARLLSVASRLSGDMGREVAELLPGLGLMVSEVPLPDPWFESFMCVAACAAREDAIRETLVKHGLRARSVRVRGGAGDADSLTRALGARPDGDAVVFLYREGKRARAIVARTAGDRGGPMLGQSQSQNA